MTSDAHHFPGLHIDINSLVPIQGHSITFIFVLRFKMGISDMVMNNVILNIRMLRINKNIAPKRHIVKYYAPPTPLENNSKHR